MFLLILRKRQSEPHLFNSPAELFKVAGHDPLRLTMMMHLVAFSRIMCRVILVGAHRHVTAEGVSAFGAQLREYGLLLDRKEERWVYYRLNPQCPTGCGM